jgi:hypothetical protein
LDGVALRLQKEPQGKLVVIGSAEPGEGAKTAAERAANVKRYLSSGEGKQEIDPSRIEVRTTAGAGKNAECYWVPAGGSVSMITPH